MPAKLPTFAQVQRKAAKAIPSAIRRESPSRRGYDARWQKVRVIVLMRDLYLCQACKAYGRLTTAHDVDHIVPIARGGKRYDEANLQSLCKACHSRKTASEDGGFGRGRDA